MTDATECSFDGCAEPFSAKGFCRRHYCQFANGRPLTPLGPKRQQYRTKKSLSPLERLHERAERADFTLPHLETPCLVWTGYAGRGGYGVLNVDGRTWRAHRLAHFIATGEEPEVVRHHCDNPPCIEPTHLASGSHLDNAHDRDTRGRTRAGVGERNGHAKLTWLEVREIRASNASGVDLAAKYGVSKPAISMIRSRRTWRE